MADFQSRMQGNAEWLTLIRSHHKNLHPQDYRLDNSSTSSAHFIGVFRYQQQYFLVNCSQLLSIDLIKQVH